MQIDTPRIRWEEPRPGALADGTGYTANVAIEMTVPDAIAVQRASMLHRGIVGLSDEVLLADFMVNHWAWRVKSDVDTR